MACGGGGKSRIWRQMLAEKAQKLADKLEKAEDEMTTAQLKRYAKITEKMSKALLDN